MAALVDIEYQGAYFTESNSAIHVGNGGSFALADAAVLSVFGTRYFSALTISATVINFTCNETDPQVNAQISVPVNASNGDPTIMVVNVEGGITVMWPTPGGPRIEVLTSGQPITLSDLGY